MDRAEFKLPPLATATDWLLLGAVLVCSLTFYGFRMLGSPGEGRLTTVVQVGDKQVAVLPANVDTVLVVTGRLGGLRIVQCSGEIWFEDAPCRLKICERTGHIHRAGEAIVCAPNKVMVRRERDGAGSGVEGLDAISR
jgi:hypothetical protein